MKTISTLLIASLCISHSFAQNASFTMQQTGGWVEFNNTSTNATSYLWDFGNGVTTTLKEAPYFFMNEGMYNVCLVAINANGSDTFCTPVTVGPITKPNVCWTATYTDSITANFSTVSVGTDDSNNVYVSGAGSYVGAYTEKLTTIKYNSLGQAQWIKNFSSGIPNDQYLLNEMSCDKEGNVYIVFSSLVLSKWALVKYNSGGVQQWVHYGNAGEWMTQIALDEFGNIFTGGGTLENYFVIKFYPDSSIAWSQTYDYGFQDNDIRDIASAPGGKIYVSGICVSHSSGSQWDGVTVAYDSSGAQMWVNAWGGTTSSDDRVVTDQDGNAYMLGTDSEYGDYPEVLVHKHGSPSYSKDLPDYNDDEYARDIGVDSSGNCYVTARVDLDDEIHNVMVKYDPAGNVLWNKILLGSYPYTSQGYQGSYISRIKVNAAGDVFFTGYSKPAAVGNTDEYNLETGKMNTDGIMEWLVNYDQASLEDYTGNMTLDRAGNLLVIGKTETSANTFEMLTVKYCLNCLQLPLVSLELPQDTFCLLNADFSLSGGSPAGGIYSGNGVSNGTFNPFIAGIGAHDIVYTYSDSAGCTNSETQTVDVEVCTGEQLGVGDCHLSVFPNPFSDFTTIQFSFMKNLNLKIELHDLSGRNIKTIARGNYEAGNHQLIFSAEDLPKGSYLLQLKSDSSLITRKIILD